MVDAAAVIASAAEGGDGHGEPDLKDGVLGVTIPKKPEVQAKRITVGSGDKGAATAKS
jgi:hypothetical protein